MDGSAYNLHVHAAFSCIDWSAHPMTSVVIKSDVCFDIRFTDSHEVCVETVTEFVKRAKTNGLLPVAYCIGTEAVSGLYCCSVSFSVPS